MSNATSLRLSVAFNGNQVVRKLSKAKTILTAVPKLAKTVITNAPNTVVDRAKKLRDYLLDVKAGRASLDMTGYHNAEAVGEEADEGGSALELRPFPSSSSSPPSTSHLPLPEGQHSSIRGVSAPLDVQATILTMEDSWTSPLDYTWEWGAFRRVPIPARPTFKPLVKDDGVVATAGNVNEGTSARQKPSSSDPEGETSTSIARGSQLFPDESERELFWVNVEGRTFSFQDLVQQRQTTPPHDGVDSNGDNMKPLLERRPRRPLPSVFGVSATNTAMSTRERGCRRAAGLGVGVGVEPPSRSRSRSYRIREGVGSSRGGG
ncbi:hypothetical protein M407DRAFT_226673 [Tulasnella calospora MUT 4182]|uniref:Uncharacterized protein n=1 Tax=Tulasnella calospora MUT 4182 TaxID=1051891 RepID=A0A0C3L7D4_9AGAM|nr:hypothetical protein M407DRAFT_226673 [Tulasnella calospora MUT 4182]